MGMLIWPRERLFLFL